MCGKEANRTGFSLLQKKQQETTLQYARLSGTITKLECRRGATEVASKCALKV